MTSICEKNMETITTVAIRKHMLWLSVHHTHSKNYLMTIIWPKVSVNAVAGQIVRSALIHVTYNGYLWQNTLLLFIQLLVTLLTTVNNSNGCSKDTSVESSGIWASLSTAAIKLSFMLACYASTWNENAQLKVLLAKVKYLLIMNIKMLTPALVKTLLRKPKETQTLASVVYFHE